MNWISEEEAFLRWTDGLAIFSLAFADSGPGIEDWV